MKISVFFAFCVFFSFILILKKDTIYGSEYGPHPRKSVEIPTSNIVKSQTKQCCLWLRLVALQFCMTVLERGYWKSPYWIYISCWSFCIISKAAINIHWCVNLFTKAADNVLILLKVNNYNKLSFWANAQWWHITDVLISAPTSPTATRNNK